MLRFSAALFSEGLQSIRFNELQTSVVQDNDESKERTVINPNDGDRETMPSNNSKPAFCK